MGCRLQLVVSLSICGLLGCASPQRLVQAPDAATLHAFLQQFRTERLKEPPVVVLSAEMTVSGIAFPVSCRAEIAGSDSLYAELWGPLGFALGQLRATPETLTYYDALRNLLVESRPRPEFLQKMLGVPLTYGTLLALLRQRPPLPEVPEAVSWDSSRALLILQDTGGNRLEFRFPQRELHAYEARLSPESTIRVTYSDWQTAFPAYARVVQLRTPRITLICRVQEFGFRQRPSGPYVLAVPSDATRVVLE
ncbi:hypothetical protein HRbin21_00225 [bacterium HR21]|jgi:hypothetical protein|nr:hypothetical protein HRbin21_00225 [bacterium HR21]